MAEQEATNGASADAVGQQAADRLAVALEEVGFDVGRAFPMLRGGVDRDGAPIVDLGRVTEGVATELAFVLATAAECGVTL